MENEKGIYRLRVSAPGRICLFGEHQDYLGLPVIASAISLRLNVEGSYRDDSKINLDLPDIGKKMSFFLDKKIKHDRNFFISSLKVLRRKGFSFSHGFNCRISGNIPINAGTSSSSALAVASVNFLAHLSDQHAKLTSEEIASYAYEAEVLEFSGQGGMMDQYTSAFGGTIFLDLQPELEIEHLQPNWKSFVLGDSGEQKVTQQILKRVKDRASMISSILKDKYPDFSWRQITSERIQKYAMVLSDAQIKMLKGTARNYAITLEARNLLSEFPLQDDKIGDLLNEQQRILRNILGVSTRKLDRLIESALTAGACGAKINGSGGGGCMFAYVPGNPEPVAEAIEKAGGKAYMVHVDGGTRVDSTD